MNAKKHMDRVAAVGCVICREHMGGIYTPCQVHHIGEGSEPRSDFAVAGLCAEHHQGATGIHGRGVKAFCRLWGLGNEYQLLRLVNKWME